LYRSISVNQPIAGADVDIWAIQDSPIENALSAAKTFNCSFFLSENNYTIPDKAKIFECMNRLPTSAFSIPLQLNTFHVCYKTLDEITHN